MKPAWSFMGGGPVQGRRLRYLLVLIAGWAAILSLAGAFYVFSERTYESGFTLILPGAGASTSVNLESLGQTSSNAASPFSSHSLSPTENYKRLLLSYRLRGHVAEVLELDISEVDPPSIKLANQTKLMYVTVRASTPGEAKLLADTWLDVFEMDIKALRDEEQALREAAYRATIASFEAAVEEARARIIAFQSEYGLISIEQFQELVALTDVLAGELARAQADVSVAASEVTRLAALIGISPDKASDVMTLLSDTTFQNLHDARAIAETHRSELSELFGPNHPELMSATEEYAGLHAGLIARGRSLLGYRRFAAIEEVYYASTDERADLIVELVKAAVALSGKRKRREALAQQLKDTQARVEALSVPATELDALLRDHKVAETVFASALARIDTNRTDVFASYPLTQTVESPGLPNSPATPSKQFIALGAIAGMFLFAIGLALLWIRLPVIRVLLKTL